MLRGLPLALVGTLALFTIWQALQKPLNHDEHQFVASGWLLARSGLLPYRDYPYFHLPYLSLINAAAFGFTDHLLLAARIISATALLVSVGLLYHLVASAASSQGEWVGGGVAAAWLVDPVTRFTSGLAWNHDLALALGLGAIWCLARGGKTARWYFVSGVCLAAATGVRATFAFGVLALGLVLALQRVRRSHLIAWLAGCAAGAAPLLWFFFAAPSEFVFGNWTYAALNTAWRVAHEFERAMSLDGKLAFLGELVSTSQIVILLAILLLGFAVSGNWRRLDGMFLGAGGLTVAMSVSALAPTPTFTQYYHGAIGFAALSLGTLLASISDSRWRLSATVALVAVSIVSFAVRGSEVRWVATASEWSPLQTHAMGAWIAEHVPSGPIATLAPILVLEADRDIYPELATGPFGYRVSSLLKAEESRSHRLIGVDDFAQLFATRAPSAILLGYEPEELEEPMAQWAQARLYRYLQLPNGKHLWAAP